MTGKEMAPEEGEVQIRLFEDREIRRMFHEGMWYFSIIDVIAILTESPEPASYWAKMKSNDPELRRKWTKLKMPGVDGKKYPTECGIPEEILRIVQSVPSPNAEPIKKWLAKVGFERLEETANPELAIKRVAFNYMMQGRDAAWIDARLKGMAQRQALTDEWKRQGIEKNWEYAMLSDEVAKRTFGLTTKEHKQVKELGEKHPLREHMSRIELIFAMLGEASTTEISQVQDEYGFFGSKKAAQLGGEVAGKAREELEKRTGKPVVTEQNFLTKRQKEHLLKKKGEFTGDLALPKSEEDTRDG